VILLLDRISEFLIRTEPTNPVPLILQRAKRIMGMNFLELMNDLAPGGVEQVRVVTGPTEGEGGG
jgi:type VI secretion system protein ImpA